MVYEHVTGSSHNDIGALIAITPYLLLIVVTESVPIGDDVDSKLRGVSRGEVCEQGGYCLPLQRQHRLYRLSDIAGRSSKQRIQ